MSATMSFIVVFV